MSDFRVYDDSIALVEECTDLRDEIAKRNRSLANQLDRCMPSVAQNIAEGQWRTGGHSRERFETAMGSARETKACLDIAVAMRLLTKPRVAKAWRLADGICAQLWRMTRGRR